MKKEAQATRSCSVCGQKKPLLAFLEIGGGYGSICSTCRGTAAKQKHPGEVDRGDTTGTTRFQIDNKARMSTEVEGRELFKQKTELESDEKSKKEGTKKDKVEEKEKLEKSDKTQREDYLEGKKEGDKKSASTQKASSDKPLDKQKGKGQAQSFQSFYQDKSRTEQARVISDAQNLESGNKEEVRKTDTGDISLIAMDEQIKSVGRSEGTTFDLFRKMLGQSAAINRTLIQYGKMGQPAAEGKKAGSFSSFLTQPAKETKTAAVKKEAPAKLASEFVSNNMKKR